MIRIVRQDLAWNEFRGWALEKDVKMTTLKKPYCNPPTVDQIHEMEIRGPWRTKSQGELNVIFALSMSELLGEYLSYDQQELDRLRRDIRGFRIYTVQNLSRNQIGANEFHRIRKEIVIGLEGRTRWTCEDLLGGKREFILTPQNGIWIPPFVLHTYHVLEDGTGHMAIANTLFDPADPDTHDTFSLELFRSLQADRLNQ